MGIITDMYGNLRVGRTLALGAFFVGSLALGPCNFLNNYEYSSGERTGMINKISKKGLVWKTYEGQMALEGISSTGGSVGANLWDFSIDGQARHGENAERIVQDIKRYMQSGQKVRVIYVEPVTTWPWRSKTDYLVQSVDSVGSR